MFLINLCSTHEFKKHAELKIRLDLYNKEISKRKTRVEKY